MRGFIEILILLPSFLFAQIPSRNKYENRWAVQHPFAAIKVRKIYKVALNIYVSEQTKLLLDPWESGGRRDAFRHAYFMAAFAQKVSVRKLRKLGYAHEKNNRKRFTENIREHGSLPDSSDTVMDLFNNELGFTVGKRFPKYTAEELKNEVISELNRGNALIISRNKFGDFLNCSGEILSAEALEKWNNPKCLVKSDQPLR